MVNKRKVLLIILLGILVIAELYVTFATVFINDDLYKKIASDYITTQEKRLKVSVEKVRFSFDMRLANDYRRIVFINSLLLMLNGNKALMVSFERYASASRVPPPLKIYINPLTKRIIGIGQ